MPSWVSLEPCHGSCWRPVWPHALLLENVLLAPEPLVLGTPHLCCPCIWHVFCASGLACCETHLVAYSRLCQPLSAYSSLFQVSDRASKSWSVKSHDSATFSRICAKFRILKAKLVKQALFYDFDLIWLSFNNLTCLRAQNFNEIYLTA